MERPPVGSISESLATAIVSDALRKAIEKRRPETKDLPHHSDRGCQYTSDTYQKTLAAMEIKCWMSQTGGCYDNAVMERFFWSLKQEWTNHEEFPNLADARLSVFEYIDSINELAKRCLLIKATAKMLTSGGSGFEMPPLKHGDKILTNLR